MHLICLDERGKRRDREMKNCPEMFRKGPNEWREAQEEAAVWIISRGGKKQLLCRVTHTHTDTKRSLVAECIWLGCATDSF